MRIFAFLSLIVVSISCLVQARGPVKITSVDVRVYPHSYFSSLEYSASFRVRLDGRNEVWVCDVGEVTDGSTDWVSLLFHLCHVEGKINRFERRPDIFAIARYILSLSHLGLEKPETVLRFGSNRDPC